MEIQNFSSRVEKYLTCLHSVVNFFFQHEKRNVVSPHDHVIFYLLYTHQCNTKPFYLNSFLVRKGAIYYVAIAMVIFSHVKVIIKFLRETSPGISLVFI